MALPGADGDVTLGRNSWPLPDWPELEDWADTLAERGGLLVDEEVRKALGGNRVGASERA